MGHRRRGRAAGRAADRWYVEQDTDELDPQPTRVPMGSTTYGPDIPDRHRRFRILPTLAALLLIVGLGALGVYLLYGSDPVPAPSAAPAPPLPGDQGGATASDDGAPSSDATPTEVPVQALPPGELGPGRWALGDAVASGVWVSDGRTADDVPCYAEVFKRGPRNTLGASVARVVRDQPGPARIRVPDIPGYLVTSGCKPWTKP